VNVLCPGFIETPKVMERGVEAGTHPEDHMETGMARLVSYVG
jgi:hypothetical protein